MITPECNPAKFDYSIEFGANTFSIKEQIPTSSAPQGSEKTIANLMAAISYSNEILRWRSFSSNELAKLKALISACKPLVAELRQKDPAYAEQVQEAFALPDFWTKERALRENLETMVMTYDFA